VDVKIDTPKCAKGAATFSATAIMRRQMRRARVDAVRKIIKSSGLPEDTAAGAGADDSRIGENGWRR
jgi:hypothetical protein